MSDSEKVFKKPQRIKMRMYGHPVKLDGTVVEFAPDGKWFKVEFDGPIPITKFWRHSEHLVTDKQVLQGEVPGVDCQIWEVV